MNVSRLNCFSRLNHQSSMELPMVCVVGAGFGGICAAVKLKTELGLNNITIFDSNKDLGGTWHSNTYPGCSSDVPIHLYTYSFEPRSYWKEKYAMQPEILEYLRDVCKKHKLISNIRCGHEVREIRWNNELMKWKVNIKNVKTQVQDEHLFDIVIMATGLLRVPNIPEKFSAFRGVMIHTARWDPEIHLEGKVVAVVGVGASGVQIIPEVSKVAKNLIVYQRRPGWVLPKFNSQYNLFSRLVYKIFPKYQKDHRESFITEYESLHPGFLLDSRLALEGMELANSFRESQLEEFPDLLEQLTPADAFGCTRLLFSNDYYPVFKLPTTKLITSEIETVSYNSITTSEGEEKIDVLILATGFKTSEFFSPIYMTDKNGKCVLTDWTENGPSLYLGIAKHELPNMFFVYGPNTSISHNSVILMIETQVNWIVKCIEKMISREAWTVAVRKEVEEEYMYDIRQKLGSMVWTSDYCKPSSQYFDKKGNVIVLYPGSVELYKERAEFREEFLEFK